MKPVLRWRAVPIALAVVIGVGLVSAVGLAGVVGLPGWSASPAAAAPTPGSPTVSGSAATTSSATSPALASPAALSTAPTGAAAITVTITDGVTSVQAGQRLGYQVVVGNESTAGVQLLLEVTVPAAATVVDAGGGAMQSSRVDYNISVPALGQTVQKFALTVGQEPAGTKQLATVASVYLLGGAGASAAAVQATDTNAIEGATAGPTHSAQSGSAAVGSSRHTGWWIGALVLGALLVIAGLLIAFRRGSDGRRRAVPGQPSGLRSLSGTRPNVTLQPGELPHPRRAARRAAEAARDAGIRTGAHQTQRPVR